MSNGTHFKNPDFVEYVRLLSQLHQLIREGTDETPEGEALRDRMDEPGSRLSPEEVASVNGISADFYSLAASSAAPVLPQTNEVQEGLKSALEARDHGDCDRALELLRKHAAYLNPAMLSFVRGSIWADAGEDQIALQFFRRASQLDPSNSNCTYLVLHRLSKVDMQAARRQSQQVLENAGDHSTRVVLEAAGIIFQSTLEHPDNETRSICESLIPIFEQSIVRLETSGEGGGRSSLLTMAFSFTASCYELLGFTAQARRYYDRGLSLFPDNDALLVSRGILLYGRETDKSIQDFEKAVERNSQVVWPYFYLAHHALLNSRFAHCLDLCNRALRLPASSEVQASLLEWTAISEASLGYPAQAVESIFLAAQELAPRNERIKRNLHAFRASQRPSDAGWDKGSEQEVQMLGKRGMRPAA